jgi:hypothetical protein
MADYADEPILTTYKLQRLSLLAFIITSTVFADVFLPEGMFFYIILVYVWYWRLPHWVKLRFGY